MKDSYDALAGFSAKKLIRKREDDKTALTDPYKPFVNKIKREIAKENKMFYQANILVRNPPVWTHELILSRAQCMDLIQYLELAEPNWIDDVNGVYKKLTQALHRWASANFKGQFMATPFGSNYNRQLQLMFENKPDVIKWKLAWHGL